MSHHTVCVSTCHRVQPCVRWQPHTLSALRCMRVKWYKVQLLPVVADRLWFLVECVLRTGLFICTTVCMLDDPEDDQSGFPDSPHVPTGLSPVWYCSPQFFRFLLLLVYCNPVFMFDFHFHMALPHYFKVGRLTTPVYLCGWKVWVQARTICAVYASKN